MTVRPSLLAAFLSVSLAAVPIAVPAHAAPHGSSAASEPVTVTIERVDPLTPEITAARRSLRIDVQLTNTSDVTIKNVVLAGERNSTLTTQQQLTSALKTPPGPSDPSYPVAQTGKPHPVTLAPHTTVETSFTTSTSPIDDDVHLCICALAVYPITLSAVVSGSTTELGRATTFIPSAYQGVHQTDVAWLWPLIERPHRLDSETVFEDDALAASITSGGRLDRALAVAEALPPTIPLTLLVDPETIAELQVMADGNYRYRSSRTTIRGTHGPDAAEWLTRLRDLLLDRPADHVSLTPYADPDVETMTRQGRQWRAKLPTDMSRQVTEAFGGVLPTSAIYAPAAPKLSAATVQELAADGVTSLILPAAALLTHGAAPTEAAGSLTLTSGGRTLTALATDPTVSSLVSAALTTGGTGVRGLPTIMAELAMKAIPDPLGVRETVLTAPRYVDASVSDAVKVIEATSTSTFTRPVSVSAEAANPLGKGSLGPHGATSSGLPTAVFRTLALIAKSAGTLQSMLTVTGGGAGQSPTPSASPSGATGTPTSGAASTPSTPVSTTGTPVTPSSGVSAGSDPGTSSDSPATPTDAATSGATTSGAPTSPADAGSDTTSPTVPPSSTTSTTSPGSTPPTGSTGTPTPSGSTGSTSQATAPSAGAALLQSLPIAEQRLQSSAWRNDAGADARLGAEYADDVAALIRTILSSVQILPPHPGSYTLGSSNSKIPITVRNSLPYDVEVMVVLKAVGNVSGFSSRELAVRVPADSTKAVELSTTIQRPGGYQIHAYLSALNGADIGGPPVSLTIHSTALGRIGIIITLVAGGLLVLALLLRAVRGVRRRRLRKRGRAVPATAAGTS